MSNADKRTAIAAALSTVATVTGHAHRPAVANARDGWPQWGGAVPYGNTGAFYNTWRVFLVVAGGDDVTADSEADVLLTGVFEALSPHLSISRVEPAELVTEAGPIRALMFTGESE